MISSSMNTIAITVKQRLIIIIASIVIVVSIGLATFFALHINDSLRNEKKKALEEGYKLYIVIERYEVEDYKFKGNTPIEILYKEEFTNDLYHYHKYESIHGYNTVEIKNGKAQIVAADCRDKRCTRGYLTNGSTWFEASSLICYPHGFKVKWEIEYDN